MKEVYLTQLLTTLEAYKVGRAPCCAACSSPLPQAAHCSVSAWPAVQVRSAMVFCATCRGCHLLGLILEELGIACAALHSQQTQGRRLAALDK